MKELDLTPLIGRNDEVAVVFNCRSDIEDFISAAKEQLPGLDCSWDEKHVDYMLAECEESEDNLGISITSFGSNYVLEWCDETWYHENGFEVIGVDELRTGGSDFEIAEDLSALFM